MSDRTFFTGGLIIILMILCFILFRDNVALRENLNAIARAEYKAMIDRAEKHNREFKEKYRQ